MLFKNMLILTFQREENLSKVIQFLKQVKYFITNATYVYSVWRSVVVKVLSCSAKGRGRDM